MSLKLLATETLCVWTGYVLSSQRGRWYISKWAMSIEFTKEATLLFENIPLDSRSLNGT